MADDKVASAADSAADEIGARRPGGRWSPAVGACLAIIAGAVAGLALAPITTSWLRAQAAGPVAGAIRADLAAVPDDPVARFYRARDDRPLWVAGRRLRPEAAALIAALDGVGSDDLTPATYRPQALAADLRAAKDGQPANLARADIDLSRAFAAYDVDLHRPPPGGRPAFVDPAIAMPPASVDQALADAARARSLSAALRAASQVNPIYAALRDALAAARARQDIDPREVAELRINLERARALPPDLGRRYILVNPASQTLRLYEGGQIVEAMRVVVGRPIPIDQTPTMIGLMREAVLDPYWYVPPDLARESVAPKVLAQGPAALAADKLEVLSDWSPAATPVPSWTVDWQAVADGRATVRLRQDAGPANMMGEVKYVFPNPLGVYLHDTPAKYLFDQTSRADSHGCVRLANAAELGQRLFGRLLTADPALGAEQRVDLATPIPVYILYLTAEPDPGGVSYLPDVYRRDPQLLAALR